MIEKIEPESPFPSNGTEYMSPKIHLDSQPRSLVEETDLYFHRSHSVNLNGLPNISKQFLSSDLPNNQNGSSSTLKFVDDTESSQSGPKISPTSNNISRPSLFLTEPNQAIISALKSQGNLYDSGEETSDLSDDMTSESQDENFEADYSKKPVQEIPVQRGPSTSVISRNAEIAPRVNPSNQETELSGKISKNNTRDTPINSNASEGGKNNIFYILNSPSPSNKAQDEELPSKIKGLLFNHNHKNFILSCTELSSSVSSLDASENDEGEKGYEGLDEEEEKLRQSTFSAISNNFAGSKLSKSSKSTKSDTESEWLSVSSDGELPDTSPIPPPLSFSKRAPLLNSPKAQKFGTNNDHGPLEGTGSFAPRSLLSGLFLNEMVHASGKNSIKSEDGIISRNKKSSDDDKLTSRPETQSHVDLLALPQKPILKRSSTTGIITIDRSGDKRSMQRPSIILLKRYASLLEISRKIAAYRSPILYVAEEDTIKEGENVVPSGYLEHSDGDLDESQLAKQVSSVGLSDFMVVANSTSASKVLQSHVENGLDQFEIIYHKASNGSESRLSTSLSKYSATQPSVGSFKNFLSKSSLNLTSLFGQSKSTSRARLERGNGPLEVVKSDVELKRKEDENVHSPGGSTYPSKVDLALGRSIKISSFPRKDFQPSVDISESLKDSLLIDHKLGKVPLPERVISEEDLFHGQDLNSYLPDTDDYHSKGW